MEVLVDGMEMLSIRVNQSSDYVADHSLMDIIIHISKRQSNRKKTEDLDTEYEKTFCFISSLSANNNNHPSQSKYPLSHSESSLLPTLSQLEREKTLKSVISLQ